MLVTGGDSAAVAGVETFEFLHSERKNLEKLIMNGNTRLPSRLWCGGYGVAAMVWRLSRLSLIASRLKRRTAGIVKECVIGSYIASPRTKDVRKLCPSPP